MKKIECYQKAKPGLRFKEKGARLRMCNLRQRRRVEELPEQRETRLASERESKKRRRAEESKEQQGNRLEADRESKKRKRAEESEQSESYHTGIVRIEITDRDTQREITNWDTRTQMTTGTQGI